MRIPSTPPSLSDVLDGMPHQLLLRAVEAGRRVSDYPSWDKLRRRPTPPGLTSEQWWAGVKLARSPEPLPLRDRNGRSFVISSPALVQQALYDVSIATAGRIGTADRILGDSQRDRYLLTSLREEAISSSLLEGAATTRREAKEMLRTHRRPRTKGERMVANNFAAMQWIRGRASQPITPEAVLQLHGIVTAGTLDDASDEGRMQRPGERRVVVGTEDDLLLHEPPPADELPERLEALCRFANVEYEDGWLHPLARAVLTHFMMGYDHYFVDGNGRTARALFYWVALREGHWMMEFLSISRLLTKAPAQYAKAYLDTEVDDGDLTYFLLHQLGVLQRALADLVAYLDEKQQEVAKASSWARDLGLNHRQVALVQRAIEDPTAVFTARSHSSSHGVTLQTGRSDLVALERLGVLTQGRRGKQAEWVASPAGLDGLNL